MSKASEQVEDAEAKLHAAILAALRRFTNATGLIVPRVTWDTARAIDARGHLEAVEYYGVSSDLASGMTLR